MNATCETLNLNSEELEIMASLLESERSELQVGIRRADNRRFREELRHRLGVVEALIERCHHLGAGAETKAG